MKKRADELKRPMFFSHGKTTPCGVAIGFIGRKKFKVLDKRTDKNGCILILDDKVKETNFALVNFINPVTDIEQIATLHDLYNVLEIIQDFYSRHIVLASDSDFVFDISLDSFHTKAKEKEIYYNHTLKKKSNIKFLEPNKM